MLCIWFGLSIVHIKSIFLCCHSGGCSQKCPILPFHNRTLPTALRTQAQICTFCMIYISCIFCIWEGCYCCEEPGAVKVRFSTTALTAVTGYSKLSTALRTCCMVIILKMGWLSQTDSFNVQSVIQTLNFHLWLFVPLWKYTRYFCLFLLFMICCFIFILNFLKICAGHFCNRYPFALFPSFWIKVGSITDQHNINFWTRLQN